MPAAVYGCQSGGGLRSDAVEDCHRQVQPGRGAGEGHAPDLHLPGLRLHLQGQSLQHRRPGPVPHGLHRGGVPVPDPAGYRAHGPAAFAGAGGLLRRRRGGGGTDRRGQGEIQRQ